MNMELPPTRSEKWICDKDISHEITKTRSNKEALTGAISEHELPSNHQLSGITITRTRDYPERINRY